MGFKEITLPSSLQMGHKNSEQKNILHPNQKISFIIEQRRERLCQVKLLHDTLIKQLIYKVKKLFLRNKSSDN